MQFRFYDPEDDVSITERNLPHWEQEGVTYFITWPTADSLPAPVFRSWLRLRNRWLVGHGIDPRSTGWKRALARLPKALRHDFHRVVTAQWNDLLDKGYGQCVLKRRELASVVEESLHKFDGQRYDLGDFVIMPNHVHVLVQFHPGVRLQRQCKGWKRYTAMHINRVLGKKGHFWQDESFDHLVRSAEHFRKFRDYIANNPIKAGLHDGEYVYFRCNAA